MHAGHGSNRVRLVLLAGSRECVFGFLPPANANLYQKQEMIRSIETYSSSVTLVAPCLRKKGPHPTGTIHSQLSPSSEMAPGSRWSKWLARELAYRTQCDEFGLLTYLWDTRTTSTLLSSLKVQGGGRNLSGASRDGIVRCWRAGSVRMARLSRVT